MDTSCHWKSVDSTSLLSKLPLRGNYNNHGKLWESSDCKVLIIRTESSRAVSAFRCRQPGPSWGVYPGRAPRKDAPNCLPPHAAHTGRKVCSDSWCSPPRAHLLEVPWEGA